MITYLLSKYGECVAIILVADNDLTALRDKVRLAIKEEEAVEDLEQVSVTIDSLGDWGEHTNIEASYVNDGELIEDDEYQLTKLVSY